MLRSIIQKGKEYWYYATYNTYNKALEKAKELKEEEGKDIRTLILKGESIKEPLFDTGNRKKFLLYTHKLQRII